MDAFLVRVPALQAQRIGEDPAVARALIGLSAPRAVRLELDDAWAALHFVLTGEYPIPRQKAEDLGLSWDEGSLENAIMGGVAVPFPSAYGPARYLPPGQVRVVADQLTRISVLDFRSRVDHETLSQEKVLPEHWNPDSVPDILEAYFTKMKAFYRDAATEHEGILIYFL